MILGITGKNGAGKTTVVELLLKKGFYSYSASKFITKEIIKKEMLVNRDSMIEVANLIRKTHGSDYIIASLLKKALKSKKNCVIESIRTVGEVNILKSLRIILLAIQADRKIRYSRIKKRNSSKDMVSYKKFCIQENIELSSSDPNKQNINECIIQADCIIDNNKSLNALRKQVEVFLHTYHAI